MDLSSEVAMERFLAKYMLSLWTKFLNSSYEVVHFFISWWLYIDNFIKN